MATILIVDDLPANRRFLVTLLGYDDHRLLEAADGAEGLEVARTERPNLVIADLLMPTMDGYEFVRRLRSDPAFADTRVVFCTAHYHEPEARKLAAACGVAAVLTRPCEPEVVLRTVEAAIGHAPATNEFDREPLLTDKLSRQADELRRTNERLTAMMELGLQLGSERDPGRLLQVFCDAAREIVGARYAMVGIPNGGDSQYRHFLTSGMDAATAAQVGRPGPLAGVLGSVLAAGRCFRAANNGGLVASGVPPSFPLARALLAAPVLSSARVHGWVCLLDKVGADAFSDEDEQFARMLGAQAGRAYENGSLYADLLRQTSNLAERKRGEAALRESEERFRGAFEHTGVAMVLTDTANRFIRVNAAFARMLGYSAPEMLGMTMTEITHPDDLAESYARREQLLVGEGRFFQIEKRYLHRDGRILWGLTNVSLVRNAGGRPLLYVGQVQDVTERKRIEQRLTTQHAVVSILAQASDLREAAPRLLQAVCETTGWDVGDLWEVDRQTNLLSCVDLWHVENMDIAEFHDLSRRVTFAPGVGLPGRVWTAGQPLWVVDITRDPDFSRSTAAARAGLRGGFGFPIQFRNEVLGVAGFFSRESRQPDEELLRMFDSLGSQIGQFIERKRVKGGLRLFRTLIDRMTDGIEVIDPETGRFLDVNEHACVAHGYTREEYLSLSVSDVDPLVASRPWREVIAARRLAGGQTFESQHRRKNGSTFPVEVSVTFIRLDRDYLVAVVRDITERKQLEDQFRQAQKMEAVGRLAGGVAHDFNNLLTAIIGYSELVLSNLPAGDPTRQSIQEIFNAGERAAALTRQLLVFSRKAVIEPKVLDLKSLVADVERMLRRIVGEDIQLAVAADPEAAAVKADPGQIEQVILNLVVNARDAMPQGGRLTIEVRNTELDETYTRTHADAQPGPHVLLAVTDTGCGMDAATIARVFEPFFTTKGEHGTGLGLATVHGIIKQAGGHVIVYSEVGHGTTFKAYLPHVVRQAPASRSPADQSVMPTGGETVLLVEDEEGVRALVRHVLKNCGYTILEARDGAEAVRLTALHQGRIDLLLTDVVMPRMGGREVAACISEVHPEVKVLFLSGYTDDAVVRHGILEAEVAFLHKPFTPASLAAKVREILDRE